MERSSLLGALLIGLGAVLKKGNTLWAAAAARSIDYNFRLSVVQPSLCFSPI